MVSKVVSEKDFVVVAEGVDMDMEYLFGEPCRSISFVETQSGSGFRHADIAGAFHDSPNCGPVEAGRQLDENVDNRLRQNSGNGRAPDVIDDWRMF